MPTMATAKGRVVSEFSEHGIERERERSSLFIKERKRYNFVLVWILAASWAFDKMVLRSLNSFRMVIEAQGDII